MQLKDIDSQHVIDLARRYQKRPNTEPGVVGALVGEGVPEKLAYLKVEKLIGDGYLECGVSPNYAWPTGKKLP
jgi:hypothetical protein